MGLAENLISMTITTKSKTRKINRGKILYSILKWFLMSFWLNAPVMSILHSMLIYDFMQFMISDILIWQTCNLIIMVLMDLLYSSIAFTTFNQAQKKKMKLSLDFHHNDHESWFAWPFILGWQVVFNFDKRRKGEAKYTDSVTLRTCNARKCSPPDMFS